MDSFHYFYGTGTDGYRQNQLKMLNDSATIDRTVDIAHNTSTMPNFYYDLIGNLTKDLVNGQDTINWNLYKKVDAVANVNGSSLAYEYDAQGNRVGKKYTLPDGNEKSDYYVHDAQGHTLAVYHHNKNYDPGGFAGLKDESFSLAEHDIYGSSRLGVRKYWEPLTIDTVWHAGQIGNTWDYHNFRFDTVRLWERKPWYSLEYQDNIIDTAHDYIANTFTDNSSGSATTGQKMFELTDHLGNVLATVSDKRFPMSSGADTTTIAYYTPVLHSIQDYYPFGMPMPGQTWESSNSDCQNVTQTALMPIHNYVEITALNSDFSSILGASLTTAPLAFKVTATPPNQGFSYNIAPVVPNLAQQIKIYFHAPTPFILNYKVSQSGCSLPMNTIPPGTKNYTIYFTPCNLTAIQLLITAPSVFGTTTIVIDSIVKDSISFTPELVITKVCDEGVYEYGFNGQIKDNEWAGNGNHNTALYWEYDTRIGRRGNLDPKGNAWESPYGVFGNNSIRNIDILGDKWKNGHEKEYNEMLNKFSNIEKKYNDAIANNTLNTELKNEYSNMKRKLDEITCRYLFANALIDEIKQENISFYNAIEDAKHKNSGKNIDFIVNVTFVDMNGNDGEGHTFKTNETGDMPYLNKTTEDCNNLELNVNPTFNMYIKFDLAFEYKQELMARPEIQKQNSKIAADKAALIYHSIAHVILRRIGKAGLNPESDENEGRCNAISNLIKKGKIQPNNYGDLHIKVYNLYKN